MPGLSRMGSKEVRDTASGVCGGPVAAATRSRLSRSKDRSLSLTWGPPVGLRGRPLA